MTYYIIPASLLMTLLITYIFSFFSKWPLRSLSFVSLILFLSTWSGQLWIMPFGPVTMGVAWISLFLVPIFFAFLVFALVPPLLLNEKEDEIGETPILVFGFYSWIIVIMLII